MSDKSAVSPVIRPMKSSDLPQIVEIDIKVLGKSRPEYWENKLEMVQHRAQISTLVAELDGKVVGFIIGGASRWEYGLSEDVGWIDTIGIDPDYQRKGLAGVLFRHIVENLKEMGVKSINTFVKRRDWKLLKYFESMGFQTGDMTNLELDLEP